MNANQTRALNRLRIFLNWCKDKDQNVCGLLKIIRKDFEFFNDHFTDAGVKSFLKCKDVSLLYAVTLANNVLTQYTA